MLVSSGANKVTNTNTSASSPIASASNNQTIKIVQVGNQPRKAIAIMPNTTSKIQTSALTTTTTSNVSKISSTISSSGHSASVISGSSLIPTVANSNSTLNTKDNLKRKLEEMEVELEKDRLAMEEKMAKIRKMKAELYETTPESDYNLETDDTDTNNTAM